MSDCRWLRPSGTSSERCASTDLAVAERDLRPPGAPGRGVALGGDLPAQSLSLQHQNSFRHPVSRPQSQASVSEIVRLLGRPKPMLHKATEAGMSSHTKALIVPEITQKIHIVRPNTNPRRQGDHGSFVQTSAKATVASPVDDFSEYSKDQRRLMPEGKLIPVRKVRGCCEWIPREDQIAQAVDAWRKEPGSHKPGSR